jgi:hypothetical protein
MAKISKGEPQSASDYDDRTTAAVKTVLIEIGQILGSFKGKFAVVGGAVPWLLLADADMPHVGTIDVDIGLDAEALGDGEYVSLINALCGHGYRQRAELKRFQLVRQIPAQDGNAPFDIIVDFLMPRDAQIVKNSPPIMADFAVQRADGVDLDMRFYQFVALSGNMPSGCTNTVEIAVCSIAALLAMKGHAINGRFKQKDAYDIYYCVRNYSEGHQALAEQCRPLLAHPSGATGYAYIAEKFATINSFGPTCVRRFVEESKVLGERTPAQWQQDAFGQVDAWLRALGLRT